MRSPWLSEALSDDEGRVRLFCFPYAGGGPSVFRGWERELPRGIELSRVALPGREARFGEPPIADARRLVTTLADALAPLLRPPFAFFGHSLGGLLAYELSRELKRRGRTAPARLFLSGSRSPALRRRKQDEPIHHLPRADFVRKLRELGGTPAEVLENDEIMDLVMPILRADFQLAETYRHEPDPRLDVPITVLSGSRDDHAPPSDAEAWREATAGPLRAVTLEGDHFFLHPHRAAIVRLVADDLLSSGAPAP